MDHTFSAENLQKLITQTKDDPEGLEIIQDCLRSFSAYHSAIAEMEIWRTVYSAASLGRDEYQDAFTSMNRARTACHNALLSRLNVLNRMARGAGLDNIYSGTISEEQPYRRQAADAVLSFVEHLIQKRD